jgi:hypothetical protein
VITLRNVEVGALVNAGSTCSSGLPRPPCCAPI